MSKLKRKVHNIRINAGRRNEVTNLESKDMSRKAIQDSIVCPEVFSLEQNRNMVLETIAQIRLAVDDPNIHLLLDFRSIKRFDFSASLMLVAELYRTNMVQGKKLSTFEIRKWDPFFRYRLHGLGFFNLMQVGYPERLETADRRIVKDETRFLKYVTGGMSDVPSVKKFVDGDIKDLVGEAPLAQKLASAITESMTNTNSHAYEIDNPCQKWWLSGAFSKTERILSIQIYDQGLGIPETLITNFGENVRVAVSRFNPRDSSSQASLIQAAHELNRSGMIEKHRGNGLPRDIRGYWEDVQLDGHYRVLSRRGEYKITRSNGQDSTELRDHRSDLRGTLIEWRLEIVD